MTDTVRETCSCGADFEYTGSSPMTATRAWRGGHRHEDPFKTATVLRGGDRVLLTLAQPEEVEFMDGLFMTLAERFPGVEFTVLCGASGIVVENGQANAS